MEGSKRRERSTHRGTPQARFRSASCPKPPVIPRDLVNGAPPLGRGTSPLGERPAKTPQSPSTLA